MAEWVVAKEQMAQLVRDGETGAPLRQGGIDQQDAPALPKEEEGPEGTAGLSCLVQSLYAPAFG